MDFLHTVYFFFGLQGIIVAFLVVADGIRNRSARKYLGIYLFSFSVIILSWVGYWEGYHKMYRLLLAYPLPFSFLLAPTAYFYIREKSGVSPVSYHLFLFYLGLLLIFFAQLTALYGDDLIKFRPIFATLPYIRMLQFGIYIFFLVRDPIKFKGDKQKSLIFVSLALLLFSEIVFKITYSTIGYIYWIDFSTAILFTIGFYIFVYLSLNEGIKKENKKKYGKSNLNRIEGNEIFHKAKAHLEKSHAYLKPNYDLTMLSRDIKTPKYRISHSLNYKRVTFYDLLNEYRIAYAKELLISENYEHYTIDAIAEMSGFKNRITFYNYFKKITHISPGEYKKLNKKPKVS